MTCGFVWRAGVRHGRRGTGVCSAWWSATFPVEPGDELAVDLAGGFEFLGALCELLSGLEQRLFELGQPGAGGIRVGGRVVEAGERVLAEELAEAPAQGGELGGQAVVRCFGVGEVGA